MPHSITTTFDLPQWPSPSPAPSATLSLDRHATVSILTIPLAVDSVFDIATVSLIVCLILLSLLSLTFVAYLKIVSRRAHKLQNFTSHWPLRVLLILFVSLWSLAELLRLPSLRRHCTVLLNSLFPFLIPKNNDHSPLFSSLSQQTELCKVYIVLSLGVLEPGFLIALLFLVNVSIKKPKIGHRSTGNNYDRNCSSLILAIIAFTVPLSILLYLSVYHYPSNLPLPDLFHRSWLLLAEQSPSPSSPKLVICTCPLTSLTLFSSFAGLFSVVFLFASFDVVSVAINKRLRARIKVLVGTVMVCLWGQVGVMVGSVFWGPEKVVFYVFGLVGVGFVGVCGAVGEGVLVIGPIVDALSVTGRRGGEGDARGRIEI